MKRLFSAWWSLRPKEGWTVRFEPECLTLISPDGVGAFQVSAAKKEGGAVSMNDIRELAEETLGSERGTVAQHSEFRGLHCSRTKDGLVWSYYWLARDSVLVFATYNGSDQSATTGRDLGDVEAMLGSLRLEPAA